MRPIDADALYKNLGFAEECKDCDHQYNSVFCDSSTWQVVCDAIYEAPTIDAMPRWIPCEERLPDIADTYIVSGKMKYSFEDEYEFFTDAADYEPYDEPHSYKLGDKFYNYRFHTWNDWYEGQDEYEILAWMPMPEPYDGERKDND